MVYLIACGVLERISKALEGDAMLNTLVEQGIFDKECIANAQNELERGEHQIDHSVA